MAGGKGRRRGTGAPEYGCVHPEGAGSAAADHPSPAVAPLPAGLLLGEDDLDLEVPVRPVAVAALLAALEQAGVAVHEVLSPHDRSAWPHAKRGFFRLKKRIPGLPGRLQR